LATPEVNHVLTPWLQLSVASNVTKGSVGIPPIALTETPDRDCCVSSQNPMVASWQPRASCAIDPVNPLR